MKEQEYEYCVIDIKPGEAEVREKEKDGWEICDAPEGVIGRGLQKEPTHPHSKFYFKRKVGSIQ